MEIRVIQTVAATKSKRAVFRLRLTRYGKWDEKGHKAVYPPLENHVKWFIERKKTGTFYYGAYLQVEAESILGPYWRETSEGEGTVFHSIVYSLWQPVIGATVGNIALAEAKAFVHEIRREKRRFRAMTHTFESPGGSV